MERGVITEIPLHVLRMFSSPSPFISRPKGVTWHTTPLSIRRGAGGEASVNSVCRRRSVSSKRWLKSSVKSVSSVREKNLYEVCKQPNRGNLTYYSPPYGGGAGGGASWDRVLGHSFWGWGRCDFYKRRNCPAFLSCYFFVAKQRFSWYEKGY